MSQTNFNSTNQNTEKKKIPLFYWVIVAVLLVSCVFLFMSKFQANESEKKEVALKDSVEKERKALEEDFQAATSKIDQMMSEKAKTDSALNAEKKELDVLKNKVHAVVTKEHVTMEELKSAREMVKEMTEKIKVLEERIAVLEKENKELTGQNEELKGAVDSAKKQNMQMKKYGSVLSTNNIRLIPGKLLDDGTVKEAKKGKAKKTKDIRIMFDIVENHIAESGNKKIYLRIVGPDNMVLSDTASGSGVLTTTKGEQVNYTVIKQITLTKGTPVKDVTVDWSQTEHFKKGNYTIEIYSEGMMVGIGAVKLK